jgi:hypothetical protein
MAKTCCSAPGWPWSSFLTLCGKGRVDFLLSLERLGVPVSNLRAEDAAAEIAFAMPT